MSVCVRLFVSPRQSLSVLFQFSVLNSNIILPHLPPYFLTQFNRRSSYLVGLCTCTGPAVATCSERGLCGNPDAVCHKVSGAEIKTDCFSQNCFHFRRLFLSQLCAFTYS
jgi:hypothetical protein